MNASIQQQRIDGVVERYGFQAMEGSRWGGHQVYAMTAENKFCIFKFATNTDTGNLELLRVTLNADYLRQPVANNNAPKPRLISDRSVWVEKEEVVETYPFGGVGRFLSLTGSAHAPARSNSPFPNGVAERVAENSKGLVSTILDGIINTARGVINFIKEYPVVTGMAVVIGVYYVFTGNLLPAVMGSGAMNLVNRPMRLAVPNEIPVAHPEQNANPNEQAPVNENNARQDPYLVEEFQANEDGNAAAPFDVFRNPLGGDD